MENLNYLTELIEDSKKNLRLDNKATLLGLSSRTMAIKLAKSLEVADNADMTAWCGKLGKKILQGYENEPIKDPYNHFEKKLRKFRIHVGFWIFRTMEREGILTRYRKDHTAMVRAREAWRKINNKEAKLKDKEITKALRDEKFQYVIMETEKGRAIIDMILQEVPVGKRGVTGEPCKWKPLPRTQFNDPIAGPLVSKYDVDDIRYWTPYRIPLVYDFINDMQQTPFRINNSVLKVYEALKKEGVRLWEIKKTVKDPEEVRSLVRDEEMCLYYADKVRLGLHYYYWNLDFRGRRYVMSTYLTPQGNKVSKSLIKLGVAKPLGEEGWFWLGVHTANCAGHDKLPLDKRYDWFEDNLQMMRKIGRNPLKDRRWMKMDDPFGFLACCLEVKKAYAWKGGVFEYPCSLMVGQDCTTSGLQIWSLITRDEETGKHCNLTPSDNIGDSYKLIADKVWSDLEDQDFWQEHKNDRRSIVKRSVMVKYYACGKKQMGEHIYNDEKHKRDGITEEDAKRLGEAIFDTCDELLPGPKRAMDRLMELGMNEAGMVRDGDKWKRDKKLPQKDFTLELPFDRFTIVQKYRVDKTSKMNLWSENKRIQARYIAEPGKYISIGDVMTGTGVNVIHGLDNQLVAKIWSLAVDYDVVPVHDCFSTIPADMGKLFEDSRRGMYELFNSYRVGTILKQKGYRDKFKYGKLRPKWLLDNQYCIS